MERNELLECGIAVHRVGDVYDQDQDGMPISDIEKGRWFVSALADSALASTVREIPAANSQDEAWELAAQHVSIALRIVTT